MCLIKSDYVETLKSWINFIIIYAKKFFIIYFSVSIRKNLFGLWDLNVINGLREIEDKIEKAE